MTKELERRLDEELKRACTAAARAAIKKGMRAEEMQRAAEEAANVTASAVIRRFMDAHNLDCVTSRIKVSLEVGPRKVVEFERDPTTLELMRSTTRTVL